jgi:sulfur relay (sulfurtransferase) DsrF/TusC family protein
MQDTEHVNSNTLCKVIKIIQVYGIKQKLIPSQVHE